MRKPAAVLLALLFLATAIIPLISTSVDAADYNIGGEIRSDTGLVGVNVTLKDHGETIEETDTTESDGSFSFTLTDPDDTEYKIKFELSAYTVLSCSLSYLGNGWYDLGSVSESISDISVTMTEDPVVTGKILLGSEAFAGTEITYYPVGEESAVVTANSNGAFTITGLDLTKEYNVKFEKSGYAVSYCSLGDPQDSVYLLDPVNDRDIFVIMYPVSNTVTGTVILDEGKPLSGVNINIRDKENQEIMGSPGVTGPDGVFSFPAENGKVYVLTFTKPAYGVTWAPGLNETEEPNTYELDLSGHREVTSEISVLMSHVYGTLTGTVQNEEGSNLSEVHIEVLNSDGEVVASGTTSSAGIYNITGIPTGAYEVRMSRSDLEPQTQNVQISEGENGPRDFVAKTKITTYIFGLDLTHSMMFGGILIGIIVISIVIGYRIIIGRKVRMGMQDDVLELDDDRDLRV